MASTPGKLRTGLILVLLVSMIAPLATADEERFGSSRGDFKLTYYWIVFEDDFQGRPSVPLYNVKHKVLAVVSETFASRVSMEGTGVLRDGRVVNLHKECKFARFGWCFFEVNKDTAPFGFGNHAPLHPFRTIAVPEEIIERGTVVYIRGFDGMPLPGDEGGFDFHDGCFVVEDTGWSLRGKHIDMFALSEAYYKVLHDRLGQTTRVHVFTGSHLCPDSSRALYNPENWAKELLETY